MWHIDLSTQYIIGFDIRYRIVGNFHGVQFSWMVNLYYFAGLIFTDASTHIHCVLYSQAIFMGLIFAVRRSSTKTMKLYPLKISCYMVLHNNNMYATAQIYLVIVMPPKSILSRILVYYNQLMMLTFRYDLPATITVAWQVHSPISFRMRIWRKYVHDYKCCIPRSKCMIMDVQRIPIHVKYKINTPSGSVCTITAT